MERHHIVYKSQGGMDFELNYKMLTSEQHRGNTGPHMCKETDLRYKRELQGQLERILSKEYYQINEVIGLLGLNRQQANRALRKLPHTSDGIRREDVIRRLMGGRLY